MYRRPLEMNSPTTKFRAPEMLSFVKTHLYLETEVFGRDYPGKVPIEHKLASGPSRVYGLARSHMIRDS